MANVARKTTRKVRALASDAPRPEAITEEVSEAVEVPAEASVKETAKARKAREKAEKEASEKAAKEAFEKEAYENMMAAAYAEALVEDEARNEEARKADAGAAEEIAGKLTKVSLPLWLELGEKLSHLRKLFPSTQLFSDYIKANAPAVAEIDSPTRSDAMWVYENQEELRQTFGWNDVAENCPWMNVRVIRRKFNEKKNPKPESEEGEEGEGNGNGNGEDKPLNPAQIELINTFLWRFEVLKKEQMCEMMKQVLELAIRTKLGKKHFEDLTGMMPEK